MKINIGIFLCIINFITPTSSVAAGFESLCKKIKDLPKGSDLRTSILLETYKTHDLGNPVPDSFIISKLTSRYWMAIDARDQKTKNATGLLSNTLSIVADPKSETKNHFTKKKLLHHFQRKKVKRYLKRRKISKITTKKVFEETNYIVFCNGFRCHRSSFAACQLRRMGVPSKNIYLGLGGFEGLKKNGAKTK